MTLDDLELEQLRSLDPRIVDPATLWRVGSTRVHCWNTSGRPDADADELFYMGDDEIELSVRDVLHRVPRPVAHFARVSCVFLGVGHSSAGWQYDLPDFEERTNLIVLARAHSGLVAHELAHAWQLGHIAGRRPRNAAANKEVIRLLGQTPAGFRRDFFDMENETDVMADAACAAWGFPFDAHTGLTEEKLREIDGRRS